MFPSVRSSEWRWALGISALIVALASVPYLVAWALVPPGSHYTGLLINPVDGHSYLAKMVQGAAGSWMLRLPFTAESHRPAFVFTYHLALGHFGSPSSPIVLVWIYHLARLLFGLALMMTVYGASSFVTSDLGLRRLSLLIVGLSSGLGWIFGKGPDLTVPESVTFPSLLVNAHFGLTLLLMLSTVLALTLASHPRWWPVVVLGGVLLTMIQPFAAVVVGLVSLIWLIIQSMRAQTLQRPLLARLIVFSLAALPFVGYMLWLMQTNPSYRQWMDQNVTPSPPVWQWLVGYGILIPLAIAGGCHAAKRRSPADRLLLIWIGAQVGLMFIPFGLQRRLSTGLHIPLCFLAAAGIREVALPRIRRGMRSWVTAGLLLLLFPSNLMLMLAGVGGVAAGNPYLVMTDSQWRALAWVRDNTSPDAVVLADAEFGTLVPGWGGGARVVYGHPFETLDADSMEATINDFFTGEMPAVERTEFLGRWSPDLVIFQTDRYAVPELPGYRVAWQDKFVVILQRVRS
jgi:hypothetical protein